MVSLDVLSPTWALILARAPGVLAAAIIMGITILLARLATAGVNRALHGPLHNRTAVRLIERSVHWAIVGIGTLVALSMLGINVNAAIAGLGVSGVVIGLALQSVASNLVAGVILLLRRPFRIGDAVKIGETDGTVLEITTRDTTLRRWDGELAIIPNNTVYTSIITNYSNAPLRQRTLRLELEPERDVPATMAAIARAAAAVPGLAEGRAPTVYAEGRGARGMLLALRFWVDARAHDPLQVQSDVALAVERVLRQPTGTPGDQSGSPDDDRGAW
ncbi:MAG: mechanosensitive ion channel family protein [Anaerolineae bacterium]|jgi:small conductance mechanosensitive channel|nr:mechanosensitive ion channel family protein [Chloroflexota bacterium]